MSAREVRITDTSVATVDMKLEVIVISVSDVERAKEFYLKLGWRLDVTPPGVVQFTPPGSACSVQFGGNLTSAAPGSAQKTFLIVSDIEAARNQLVAAGIDVSEIFHFGADGFDSGPDPEHRSYRSLATFSDPDGNSWLLQEITNRLPGRVDSAETSFRISQRSGERNAARVRCPRQARRAHRAGRSELVRLVCPVHRGGAVRRRAARLRDYHANFE